VIGRAVTGLVLTLLAMPVCLAAQAPSLNQVLDRVGAYLADYQPKMATVAADERFDQRHRLKNGTFVALDERRALRSDFVFLQLPATGAWLGMRDTYLVDGKPSRAPSRRLEAMLVSGEARDPVREAQLIVADNVRHNLGPVFRTVNAPTQALEMLLQQHRPRLTFEKIKEERIDGRRVWAIAFAEHRLPTIVTTRRGGDVPARGIAWVDPETGAVIRTQLDLDAGTGDDVDLTVSRIVVTYVRDPAMGFMVPAEMTERYVGSPSIHKEFEVTTRARYSGYRRFETSARLIGPQ
jgi:hypothetical protein